MTTSAKTKRELIAEVVHDQSFIDVGGLWGTKQEMVTTALENGASRAVMSDAMPQTSEWWEKFDARCRELGHTNYEKIVHDISRRDTLARLGKFDVVHCSGVLYHMPDVISTVSNLAAMAKKYLFLGSQVVPDKIKNSAGELEIPADQAICIPLMSDKNTEVIQQFYLDSGKVQNAQNIRTAARKSLIETVPVTFGPWWWFYTKEFMRGLVNQFDMKVVTEITSSDGGAHMIMAKKT